MNLKLINLAAYRHFTEGLRLSPRAPEVLESALIQLDAKTAYIRRVIDANNKGIMPPPYDDGSLIITIETLLTAEGKILSLSQIVVDKEHSGRQSLVSFEMKSPTLEIPMRLEVPLRAFLKGNGRKFQGYCVYLHTLSKSDMNLVYYGITKRGWNLRFLEHLKTSFKEDTRRLFPVAFRELLEDAVSAKMNRQEPQFKKITTTVCAFGLDEDQAMDTEEFLVEKYSLNSKHKNGLNMIPGGYEGIRTLSRLSLISRPSFLNTEEREEILDRHLKAHPQLGVPKPGVAAIWTQDEYAEAVICGRENRLTADNVREIRYLSAFGNPPNVIATIIGVANLTQIKNVVSGKTYSRIK